MKRHVFVGVALLAIVAFVIFGFWHAGDQVKPAPTRIVPTEVPPTATVTHTPTNFPTPTPTATYAPIVSAPTRTPTSTPTPEPTNTPAPSPTPAYVCLIPPGQIYVIERGDTLWHISDCAYGRAWQWPDIYQANPQLTDPGLIHAGNPLIIPAIH